MTYFITVKFSELLNVGMCRFLDIFFDVDST